MASCAELPSHWKPWYLKQSQQALRSTEGSDSARVPLRMAPKQRACARRHVDRVGRREGMPGAGSWRAAPTQKRSLAGNLACSAYKPLSPSVADQPCASAGVVASTVHSLIDVLISTCRVRVLISRQARQRTFTNLRRVGLLAELVQRDDVARIERALAEEGRPLAEAQVLRARVGRPGWITSERAEASACSAVWNNNCRN